MLALMRLGGYFVPMPNNAEPKSAAQVAAETGIPKRTILAAISRGALKASKLPGPRGAYVLNQRDVEKFLEARQAA